LKDEQVLRMQSNNFVTKEAYKDKTSRHMVSVEVKTHGVNIVGLAQSL